MNHAPLVKIPFLNPNLRPVMTFLFFSIAVLSGETASKTAQTTSHWGFLPLYLKYSIHTVELTIFKEQLPHHQSPFW